MRNSRLAAFLHLRNRRNAENVHEIESLALERADVLSEQGQHQRLVGLYNAQSDERDPAYAQPDYADDHSGVVPGKAVLVNVYCAEYKQTDRRQVQNYRQ